MRSDKGSFILLVTFLAFLLRVQHLTYQSLWRDEVDALRFATGPLPGLLSMFRSAGQNGPLFFLALRPWLAAAGHSEFALRFPSACLGTLAVPMTYCLLRRLAGRHDAGRQAAGLMALLMAVASYLVWYGQEAKMYAALTLLVPLGLWLVVRAVQRGRRRNWAGLYIVTSLGVYTHLLAALTIPVQVAWILLAPAEGRPVRGIGARVLIALAYLAALGLPYLPVLRWALPFVTKGSATGFSFVPLPQMVQTLAGFWSQGVMVLLRAAWAPLLVALTALLAGTLLWIVARPQDGWRLVAMLWAWLALPVIGLYLVSLKVPIFTERYLIWAMPAWLALQALGVVVLRQAWRPLGFAVLGVGLAFQMAMVGVQSNTPIKSDFRSAAAFVTAHRQAGDRLLFQIPYNQYIFEYYAGPLSNFAEGPFTNGMDDAQAEQWMASATAGAPAVWLIESEAWLWDQRNLTETWLKQHGTLTDRADFVLVSVFRYQLKQGTLP